MLFSFAVRSVYMESCSMFVRGGVYVVVRDSMGPVMAKLSVSALVFDYILTGPISVVSAGQYLGALLNEISETAAPDLPRRRRICSRPASAILVTIYFWWQNIKGMHESSGKALRIMQITTVMVVHPADLVPLTHAAARASGSLPPAPIAVQSDVFRRRAGLAQGNLLAADSGGGDHHRLRPLAALHERL